MTAEACLVVLVGEDLADAFRSGVICFSVMHHLLQSGLLQK